MKTRLFRCCIALFLTLLVGSPWLKAQTNTTALSGTVTDATGAVVTGVRVSYCEQGVGYDAEHADEVEG